jgi:anti-sigma factor RsiW
MDRYVVCGWIERELECDEHVADHRSGEQYKHEHFDDVAVVEVHAVRWAVPALLVCKRLHL